MSVMSAVVLSEGWDRQAFTFCLDVSLAQYVELSRYFGMRRKGRNWVDVFDIAGRQVTGGGLRISRMLVNDVV